MAEISASMVKELREITGVSMMDCKKALTEANGDMEGAKEILRKSGQAKAMKKSSRETKDGAIGMFITADQQRGGMVRLACETDFVAKNDKFQTVLSDLTRTVAEQGTDNLMEKTLSSGLTVQATLHGMVAELGENIQVVDAKQLQTASGVVGGYVHTTGKIGVLVQLDTTTAIQAGALNDLVKDLAMHITATHAEAIEASEIPQDILAKEREIVKAQALESGKPENIVEKMVEGRMKKFLQEVCVLTQPFVKNPEKTVNDLLNDAGKAANAKVTLKAFAKFQF